MNLPEYALKSNQDEINASLKEHNICFVLPFGARFEGSITLPGGALIYGEMAGDIFCKTGSLIIEKESRYSGIAQADYIYVNGEVTAFENDHESKKSILIANKAIYGSSTARIDGDIFGSCLELSKSKVWGSLHPIEESALIQEKSHSFKHLQILNEINQEKISEKNLFSKTNIPNGQINLSLRDHNIGFYLSEQSYVEGLLLLPCGALIDGVFIGDIFIESGSLILTESGNFQGMAESNSIYIEGKVSSEKRSNGIKKSILISRKLFAGSSKSTISADIYSQTFTVHQSNIDGTLRTLEESTKLRSQNQATFSKSKQSVAKKTRFSLN